MAAIIIRTQESKTPGEDFALEEREGRWRELPYPLTIKLLRAAGWLASPPPHEWVWGQLTEASPFLHPGLKVAKGVQTLPCQFTGRSKTSAFLPAFGKAGNSVCLRCCFLVWKMTRLSFLQEEKLYNLKGHDLERDVLNFNMTGLFPTFMGS